MKKKSFLFLIFRKKEEKKEKKEKREKQKEKKKMKKIEKKEEEEEERVWTLKSSFKWLETVNLNKYLYTLLRN